MKIALLLILGFIGAAQALEPVEFVDVSQYLGRWYQQSRNVLPFEPVDCVCAQQTLSLNTEGSVDVFNSCNQGDPSGKSFEIRGKAFSQDSTANNRFTVDFNLPKLGQYWILAVGPNYKWAVVSEPTLASLYILSKTPELDAADYDDAVLAASMQVPTDKLKKTSHKNCVYPN